MNRTSPKLTRACVFVDWHNVEANNRLPTASRLSKRFEYAVFQIQETVANTLKHRDSTVRYRATLRLYHGWHRGLSPTDARVVFETLNMTESFGRTIGLVSFAPEIRFGNELACDTRRNPLLNTARAQGQKMVDTAIACDLLFMLHTGLANVGIIVSDDDDFIPAVFTAEAWGLESILLRSPGQSIEHVSKEPAGALVRYWGQ